MHQSDHHSERNAQTAVNADGSRYVIHPADARGTFTTARRLTAYALIALYVSLPWIPVNGYPAVFLDTELMRFHFVGLTFASQDLWLAFFLISGLGFGLFYVTAILGRVWCGWACPQTVFLEHVYRRVERWIEGDAVSRRRLDEAPFSTDKLAKRLLKHGSFVVISLILAHLFMAYFLSLPKLWDMMAADPLQNWGVFLFTMVFAGGIYFNYAWFREQLCVIVCPYGRLQSALIDEHSLVIGYDEKRGEPRGKATAAGIGDCIDCNRCVQVCPTGIDIRQGLQMECIGCSNCIDACDTVMAKLGRPKGLIRYDSLEGLDGGKTKWLRPRIYLYTVLMLIGLGVLGFSLQGLGDATVSAWRPPGSSYYVEGGMVRNQFLVRITNKRNDPAAYSLRVDSSVAALDILGGGEPIECAGNEEVIRTLAVRLPETEYAGRFEMELRVIDEEGNVVASRKLNFIGPGLNHLGE